MLCGYYTDGAWGISIIAIWDHAASQAASAISPVPVATPAGKFAPDPSETAPSAGVNADYPAASSGRRCWCEALGLLSRSARGSELRARFAREFSHVAP